MAALGMDDLVYALHDQTLEDRLLTVSLSVIPFS
jgi:hypothetical protein